jgi:hypothetical protein
MKKIIYVLSLAIISWCIQSCTKASIAENISEEQAEDIITKKLTAHPWKCEAFSEGTGSVSEIMNQYFTFNKDKTLELLKKETNTKANGTWGGDVSTMTASVTFPTNMGLIADKLNGKWVMVRYSSYYIEMKQTVNGIERHIRLINEP